MSKVMRRVCVTLAVVGVCLLVSRVGAWAQDKPVTASDGWVKLPDAGATSTVAFATVQNPGMYAIYLVSGTTDVAGKVEFRDAGKPDSANEEVTVDAYGTTYMDAKGIHILLSELKRPLKEGETIHLTLKTELGLPVEVAAVVKK